jgi:hypothetical protein
VELGTRLRLFQALVLSRLLYCTHVVVPTRRFLTTLNDVYMRGNRRIHDAVRAGPGVETDLQFRQRTRTPSLDCVLSRLRLMYVRRLIVRGPPQLVALLRQRQNGWRSPWLDLVVKDMERMRSMSALCSRLPPPDQEPAAWFQLAAEDALNGRMP